MSSQVLSGSSNVSYTNNTGQNVRIVINYMEGVGSTISINWAGVSVSSNLSAIGRNLAFAGPSGTYSINNGNNALGTPGQPNGTFGALPTEVMLAPGESFSATCGAYNIVVISENG